LGDEDETLFQSMGMGYTPSPNTSEEERSPDDAGLADGEEDEDANPSDRDIDGLPPHDPYLIPPCNGVQDIIITGESDPRHAAAWKHFTFTGRIRNKDGLIAILRTPANAQDGKIIFYGYLQDGKNFVGRWRMCGGYDIHGPGLEGIFCMSRRE
jgi:hypothetical protein